MFIVNINLRLALRTTNQTFLYCFCGLLGGRIEKLIVVRLLIYENDDLFLNESADLLFHYLIFLQAKGYKLNDIVEVIKGREKK